ENQSVERGFDRDSLQFMLVDRCWGRFFESGITKEVDLSDDPEACALGLQSSEPRSGLHAGSTVLTIDLDNDGDKEVILGDISFSNLNLVINGGTAQKAFMTDQDTAFPSADVSVELPVFPAAFYLDVDNDGIKDMLVSPNLANDIGETYESVWYYKNVSTNENPVFELEQKDFLVEDMLDYGSGAQPVFVDYNQDGLQDLVVGNKSFFVPGGNRNARIYLYENVGTATNPQFELKNDDLFRLNVFSQNAWRFTPAFGDLDGDGDLDALIGEEFGNLFYAENIAGAGRPFEFADAVFAYQDIDVGQSSRPQIIDMNRDGLLDLVIGERNGNVNYFENAGTVENPVFTADPTNNFFGKVDARGDNQVTGFSAPTVLEIDGMYQLLVGTESGKIYQYDNIEGNLAEAFNQISTDFGQINLGEEIHLAFADLNQDGRLEVAIGNIRGGISFFETDLKSQITSTINVEELSTFRIAPNPAYETLTIQWASTEQPVTIRILGANGQLVLQQAFSPETAIGNLVDGIYVVEVVTEKGTFSKKFVKQ
ncbi:MAG: T9SS type A sorting domain-containing protein, partial [Bacteroidota bacterium]